MIAASMATRVGSRDEVAEVAALLDRAGFVTGTDHLFDGGVIAAIPVQGAGVGGAWVDRSL